MAEGDPAYDLCRALHKEGYVSITLPLLVFLSGNVKERKVLVAPSNSNPDIGNNPVAITPDLGTIADVAAAEDQLSLVEAKVDEKCVHHWILREPENGKVPGRCKICGMEKDFPAHPAIKPDYLKHDGKRRQVYLEWVDRLKEAEHMAGYHSRKAA